MRKRPCFDPAPGTPSSRSPRHFTPGKTGARGTPGCRTPRSPVHVVSLDAQAKSPRSAGQADVPRAVVEGFFPACPGGGALYPPLRRPTCRMGTQGLRLPWGAPRLEAPHGHRITTRAICGADRGLFGCRRGEPHTASPVRPPPRVR